MANEASHRVLKVPIKGCAYNVPLLYLDSAGDPGAPSAQDSEVSKDYGTFADTTNEPTLLKEVGGATDSPYGYVTLDSTEMAADALVIQAKDSTVKTTSILIEPLDPPIIEEGTAQAGAGSTITLAAGASAIEGYYVGAIVKTDGGTGPGQARHIIGYVGSTNVATIAGAWETNPASGTTYDLLVTAEWSQNPVVVADAWMIRRAADVEGILPHGSNGQAMALKGGAHKVTHTDDLDGTGTLKVYEADGVSQIGSDLGTTTSATPDGITGIEDTLP